MLSDVMTLLETQVQPVLAQGRYPERKTGRQVAEILRAIARISIARRIRDTKDVRVRALP